MRRLGSFVRLCSLYELWSSPGRSNHPSQIVNINCSNAVAFLSRLVIMLLLTKLPRMFVFALPFPLPLGLEFHLHLSHSAHPHTTAAKSLLYANLPSSANGHTRISPSERWRPPSASSILPNPLLLRNLSPMKSMRWKESWTWCIYEKQTS